MATSLPVLVGYGNLLLITLIVTAIVAVAVVYQAFFAIRYPASLPLGGEPPGARRFSLRTRWRYYTDCAGLYRQAYEQYTKKGKAVLLPGLGCRLDIILPQSAMRWVLARPENELSHADAVLEVVQLKYGLGDEKYKADPWPGMLVKTEINAMLENVCADMNDELAHAFDRLLGDTGSDSDSWKEIDLLHTVRLVVAQAASRFTVGLPLCRNQQYLRDCLRVVDGIVLNGGLTGACPRALRPILGPIFSWNLRRHVDRVKKHFEPLYRRRMQDLTMNNNNNNKRDEEGARQAKGDPTTKPPDLLQMMLQYGLKERPGEVYDVDSMARRLCFANFAAFHQTSILITNMLLNILSSDAEFNTISVLRDEVARIVTGVGSPTGAAADDDLHPQWTKYKVAQMVKADSVARETLRLNSYSNRGLFRKVMVDGIVTEEGIRLPKGAYLSFLGHPLQCDPDTFDRPFRYDPFRFSRAREAAADHKGNAGLSNLSFVATSPQHLPFGHGNHSCPGRFLVDFELKMIIAYLLENYHLDFPAEYAGNRPPNRWVAEALAPPAAVKIRVKRQKKETAH
ncbi:hypothetical protein A1O3_02749 [Capronia epimyces CBS 606.96]|uniref:Cytochrome P450 n=1 Tax=Capronia epimyces CBS 606.96 TaxID=1182542 RepID=W9Y9Z7_9EURO|nr:uncharacterized protein A1O3_02749 [Capronia epimyces CBS 606.96]EXJ89682.1 hypothetical protein A1O3_02749 [Capronia epimyces CBS 606.96]